MSEFGMSLGNCFKRVVKRLGMKMPSSAVNFHSTSFPRGACLTATRWHRGNEETSSGGREEAKTLTDSGFMRAKRCESEGPEAVGKSGSYGSLFAAGGGGGPAYGLVAFQGVL